MRVNRTKCRNRGRQLHTVASGETVSFCKQFHQDHCLGDIFLVINDNGKLAYQDRINRGKVVIANIETGKMSVVRSDRECFVVKGEFCADDYRC